MSDFVPCTCPGTSNQERNRRISVPGRALRTSSGAFRAVLLGPLCSRCCGLSLWLSCEPKSCCESARCLPCPREFSTLLKRRLHSPPIKVPFCLLQHLLMEQQISALPGWVECRGVGRWVGRNTEVNQETGPLLSPAVWSREAIFPVCAPIPLFLEQGRGLDGR